jgi:Plasmid replication region DNA-binding N-term
MQREAIVHAVQQLQHQGVPLAEISAPMIRQLTGFGSFRDITKHLREIKGEDAGAAAPQLAESPVELASAVKARLSRDASAQAGQGPEGFSASRAENPSTLELQGPEGLSSDADEKVVDDAGNPPLDPVREAERALTHAQAQVTSMERTLPALETQTASEHCLPWWGIWSVIDGSSNAP